MLTFFSLNHVIQLFVKHFSKLFTHLDLPILSSYKTFLVIFNIFYSRCRDLVSKIYWKKLVGFPSTEGSVQARASESGAAARGLRWYLPSDGRARRHGRWFHGTLAASRICWIQVIVTLLLNWPLLAVNTNLWNCTVRYKIDFFSAKCVHVKNEQVFFMGKQKNNNFYDS